MTKKFGAYKIRIKNPEAGTISVDYTNIIRALALLGYNIGQGLNCHYPTYIITYKSGNVSSGWMPSEYERYDGEELTSEQLEVMDILQNRESKIDSILND